MPNESTSEAGLDPRIHTSLAGLQALAGAARRLSLLPRQPARSVLNGRHASRLRGRGLNFEELRTYLPGDDPRSIDWRVTARTGTPHVRVYTEERDRPALLLVDQRVSMFFGTKFAMKSVIAAEAAAIAAHRLLAQGDRIGGLVFRDDAISEHRARRSHATLTRLLTDITRANQALHAGLPAGSVTLDMVLERACRLMTPNNMVLLFSDFDGLSAAAEPLVRHLARNGDLILVHVSDPASRDLLRGRFTASDGGLQADLDLNDTALRDRISETLDNRLALLRHWSAAYRFPLLPLDTSGPALPQMLRLFGHPGGRR